MPSHADWLIKMKKEEKKTGKISAYDGWEKLGACEGCSLRALCGGGNDKVPCAKQKEGDAYCRS